MNLNYGLSCKRLFALSLILSSLLFGACSKSNSNEISQIEQQILSTKAILTNPTNGWEMVVYPSKDQSYGGYTLFVKFDSTLTASSELLSESDVVKTGYTVAVSSDETQQIKLLGYNKALQLGSTVAEGQANPYAVLAGYGDESFNIVSISATEVVLEGAVSKSIAVLHPAKETAWSEQLSKIKSFSQSLEGKELELANGSIVVGSVSFNATNRQLIVTESNGMVTKQYFRYTMNGIELYKSINIGSNKLQTFELQEGTEFVLKANESSLVLKQKMADLVELLRTGLYAFDETTSTGRANTAISKEKNRLAKLLDPITFNSLKIGKTEEGYGVQIDAKQVDFLKRTKEIKFVLPFSFESKATNEVTLKFLSEKITGGENAAQNTPLYNYTYGGNHRMDLFAAPFSNVGTIKVGKTTYINDADFNARTFSLKADDPIKPTKITLIDTSDETNTITLSLQ